MRNASLYNHPSPVGNGWKLDNWLCRPIKYLNSALHVNLTNLANDSSNYIDSVDIMNGCIALENDTNENYVDENNSEAESDEDISAESDNSDSDSDSDEGKVIMLPIMLIIEWL